MSRVAFAEAERADLSDYIALLRDDALGAARESAPLAVYERAFAAMQSQGGNHLILGKDAGGAVVAGYQLILIPGLSLTATTRAQIEGVRVASHLRGQGIGSLLITDAIRRASKGGATLMQFTTNKSRADAHRFYERHGFTATHMGYKREVKPEEGLP
ncbi:GNAT family N-acetyltransferase [Paracoccaceae bacterium GXU_MW_L88]